MITHRCGSRLRKVQARGVDERLLTIAEVATLVRTSKQAAYRLAREGKLPVVRLGRNLRVDPAVLRGWIEGGGRR
ncbi:helix-turn-helix domain-containing protein [Candidatus Binatia bacterium]|nr:helix-turn-helix domain-containing protein [Candidatus Binatia bacterium]